MAVTIFHVREEADGSTSVHSLATGQLLIRNGVLQPDLSEQETRDAAELITPVRFSPPVAMRARSLDVTGEGGCT